MCGLHVSRGVEGGHWEMKAEMKRVGGGLDRSYRALLVLVLSEMEIH